jgi:NitT/TauT family transport system permease protein
MHEEPEYKWHSLNAARAVLVVVIIAIWEILGASSPDVKFAIGRPSLVAHEFALLADNGLLFKSTYITAYEVVVGFILGVLCGTAFGLALWFRPFIGEVCRPFVVIVASIPVVAFAPFFIVIAGTGLALKILITAIATFFVAFVQSYNGARGIREEHLEFMVPGQVSPRRLFRLVVVPSSLSSVFASFRMCVGTAVLATFIGEYISSDRGLGYLITRSAALYNTPRATAGAFTLCLLALILDLIGARLERSRHRISQLVGVSHRVR